MTMEFSVRGRYWRAQSPSGMAEFRSLLRLLEYYEVTRRVCHDTEGEAPAAARLV